MNSGSSPLGDAELDGSIHSSTSHRQMSQNGFFFECNTHSRDGLSKPAPNSQLNLLPLYWVYVGISVLFFGTL